MRTASTAKYAAASTASVSSASRIETRQSAARTTRLRLRPSVRSACSRTHGKKARPHTLSSVVRVYSSEAPTMRRSTYQGISGFGALPWREDDLERTLFVFKQENYLLTQYLWCAVAGMQRCRYSTRSTRGVSPAVRRTSRPPNDPYILPQILGSLPEVIRSCCHHHHHHTPPKVFAERCTNARSRGALAFTSQPPEPSGGRPWEAAFGQRHPSSPASRRSIGRPRHLEPDR